MNAVLKHAQQFRPMSEQDLDAVLAIEERAYAFPWTRGNFSDSLSAGYSCWVYENAGVVFGYAVMMVAAGEAHLLNVCIDVAWQGQGLGRNLAQHLIEVARGYHAQEMFLEVRPSNVAARHLYERFGFSQMAVRKKYYPAENGREDAILMGMKI
jgi:ribosomal-protein-alanine N-acetyltransferase